MQHTPADWSFLDGGSLLSPDVSEVERLPVGEWVAGYLIPPPTPAEAEAEAEYDRLEREGIAMFGGG